jgi:ABC-type spermidine/putrescine transport system permease subunit II
VFRHPNNTSILIQSVLDSSGISSPASGPSYTIPIVLGGLTLLLLIPPIIVGARLSLAAHAIMLEGSRARQSIDRSWQLTRDYLWRVLGFSITVSLLTFCISVLPVGAVTFGLALLGVDVQLVAGLRLALTTIADVIATPFGIIAYTLMFFDLRVRNEALDLVQNELFADGFTSDDSDRSFGVLPQ